jgi:hypothetical protein
VHFALRAAPNAAMGFAARRSRTGAALRVEAGVVAHDAAMFDGQEIRQRRFEGDRSVRLANTCDESTASGA